MPHDRFRIGADPLIARVSELAAIGVFEWHPAQGRISATPHCLTLLGLEDPEAPLTAARLWSGIADTDRDLLAEAESLRAVPVTTRKDWVRLPSAYRSRVTVVTIRLEWEEPAAIEALLDPLAARVPVPA